MRISKIAYYAAGAVMSTLMTWVLASWVDVIVHNVTDCSYTWWNIFHYIF